MSEPVVERLTAETLLDNVALSRSVGWQDTESDWRVLHAAATVFGVRRGGRLVGQVALGTYGAVGTVAKMVVAHPGKAVVAVSHADPIKAVVAHAMGTHLDLFQRIVVSPCSVTAMAGILSATASSSTSSIRHAPSRSENSVCRCR